MLETDLMPIKGAVLPGCKSTMIYLRIPIDSRLDPHFQIDLACHL